MTDLPTDHIAAIFHDVTLTCLGLVMLVADRRSPTSRALATGLILMGSGFVAPLALQALGAWPPEHWWPQYLPFVGYSLIAYAEWFRLVLRTVPVRDGWSRAAELSLRIAQVIQFTSSLAMTLSADTIEANVRAGGLIYNMPGGWIFRLLFVGAELALALPIAMMLVRKPDLQERRRVFGIAAALPFAHCGRTVGQRNAVLPCCA